MRVTVTNGNGHNGFSKRLRIVLDREAVSARELGRRLRPDNHEVGRRTVARYLNGTVAPSVTRREQIAVALGVSAEDLADDDEESDPVADLMRSLQALVRSAIREEALR